jgi:hypothetical protein
LFAAPLAEVTKAGMVGDAPHLASCAATTMAINGRVRVAFDCEISWLAGAGPARWRITDRGIVDGCMRLQILRSTCTEKQFKL